MLTTRWLCASLVGSLFLTACGDEAAVAAADSTPRPEVRLLDADVTAAVESHEAELNELPWAETPMVMRVSEPFFGDWDAIRERGVLRVLVSYSRTNFFLSEGRLRGFEYEMFNELQQQLAKQSGDGAPPLQIAYFPVPFDELLTSLRNGHGDVAAASLAVTPERERVVSFTAPYQQNVDQVFVSHRGLPPIESWDQLAGRSIHVVSGTSFCDQLEDLNADLVDVGLEPLKIEHAARGLHTEDLLELVHSGAFDYTVADRFMAELWSDVLDGIRIEPDFLLGTGGELAWAVRHESPDLEAELNEFIGANKRGSLIGNVLFKRYYGGAKWISNPLLDVERSKLGPFLDPLQRYCEEFGLDWRLIAAQAFQESRLDPTTVSSAGAVGLMQLLPSTAADMGVTDLTNPDRSLYAGVKYMDWLRRTKFDEPQLTQEAQLDFCLAAYNAGATRVRRWRKAAPGRGLDPDTWFGNVELLALEDVGLEPVRYVGNINKYYILFAMSLDSIELSRQARELEEAAIQGTKEATTR